MQTEKRSFGNSVSQRLYDWCLLPCCIRIGSLELDGQSQLFMIVNISIDWTYPEIIYSGIPEHGNAAVKIRSEEE